MPKTHFPYVVAIDWLQLYCLSHSCLDSGSYGEWTVSVSDYPTAQFLKKADCFYYLDGTKRAFCHLLFSPRLSVIRSNSVQLKIVNEQLYTSGLWRRLQSLFLALNLEFKSISRVDLCADFNKFYKGLHPLTLIKGYLTQNYLKIGINRGYVAFDSMGYTIANGSSSLPKGFKLGSAVYNGVTWGSKGYVQTQLYNKSKEMRDKQYKSWIVEQWERAGLDIDNVWRLEIRIQKAGKSVNLMETGDIFSFGVSDLSDEYRLSELFSVYVSKYARFVKRDYHVKKQQMTPIVLFSNLFDAQASIKPKIHVSQIPTKRTAKVVDNFLDHLSEYYREGVVISKVKELDYHIARVRKGLQSSFPSQLYRERSESKSSMFAALDDHFLKEHEFDDLFGFFVRNVIDGRRKSHIKGYALKKLHPKRLRESLDSCNDL